MSALLDHLQTFIAFRTVGNDSATKAACLDWIETTFLSSSGLELVRGDVQGASYVFLRHPKPKMLWFGHTDVVPGSDDQFTLTSRDGRAYGRGVKDMKGADLTFLIAYKEACDRGAVPPVSVLLTSDEETGGHTPGELLDAGTLGVIPVAFTPDTGDTDAIVTEMKGALWVRVVATGKSGHAAMPWKSENPVPVLMEAVAALQKKFPQPSGDAWGVTLTPTLLSGSDARNRIPDEASCTVDVRFPPTVCKTPGEMFSLLQKLVPAGCRLEIVESADPMFCDPAHPLVRQIKAVADAVTGSSIPIGRDYGSSDARFFTARGIPAFLYGPVGGDLHGAKEWVSVKSLEEHVEINRRLFKELS
ncbi:MAG: M20/M25/M40 family metallo-hydrolase [Candidatus Peribacteraceae bacterium]|nr:M20/M25/M40 family metallo-hydrolase [Candidatus Peribacteraceae bacterium]